MSGRIPDHFIDDLLSRVDIVEVIDRHVKLRRAGRNYQACCPFHQEKAPPSPSARRSSSITVSAAVRAATPSAS